MADLKYYSYPNMGLILRDKLNYSQAVCVENYIHIAGQGGWDPMSGQLKADLLEEVDQVFANVDLALKTAGGQGWSQVYQGRCYVSEKSPQLLERVVQNLKRWMPDHAPVFSVIGVEKLGGEGIGNMRLEIEVSAYKSK